MSKMRVCYFDIETSPHKAYVWRLYDENVGLNQLIEVSRVICAAWQFEQDGHVEPMQFAAEWETPGDEYVAVGGHGVMVDKIHRALSEADAVVHYNGTSFDERHLNREFIQAKHDPPARYQTIDLYLAIKRKFTFASAKLEQVSKELGIRKGKLHTDFTLWRDVLAGDDKAQRQMQKYNEEDVRLLVDLYHELLPWIDRHPNVALYEGDEQVRCTHCGSTDVTKYGFSRTSAGTFQRYSCRECGSQSRGSVRLASTPLREG